MAFGAAGLDCFFIAGEVEDNGEGAWGDGAEGFGGDLDEVDVLAGLEEAFLVAGEEGDFVHGDCGEVECPGIEGDPEDGGVGWCGNVEVATEPWSCRGGEGGVGVAVEGVSPG